MKTLITKDEAAALLQQHLPVLHACVDRAWADWCGMRGREAREGIDLGPIARARIVYELIVHRARRAFNEVPDVRVSQKRGFLVLIFGDDVVVRFKKLRKNLMPASGRSRQQEMFATQQELPGLPPPATYLNAGYVLDESQLEIKRIVLACAEGKDLCWWLDLELSPAAAEVIPVGVSPLPPPSVRSTTAADAEVEDSK